MQLVIAATGQVRALDSEEIDQAAFGPLEIRRRASHVEPGPEGRWRADLSPVDGPALGPFDRRSEALQAERDWLETYWLVSPG
jgi:hypothetical protein